MGAAGLLLASGLLLADILEEPALPAARPGSACFADPPAKPSRLTLAHARVVANGCMEEQMMDRALPIAGAVVALVKDGEWELLDYGFADLALGRRVNAEATLFRAGSLSKLFAWTAVMQLYEQSKLKLDEDVNQYLDRSFQIPDAFDGPVTLTHLMTHTAGLDDAIYFGHAIADTPHGLPPLQEFLRREMPARVRPPGRRVGYSNWGGALGGLIVERQSRLPHQTFAQYVEANIFRKLGMEHATFEEWPLDKALADNMSIGYRNDTGQLTPQGFEFNQRLGPAGSLSVSAGDMARFMAAHLQHGRFGTDRILEEATAKLMHGRVFGPPAPLPGVTYGFWETYINGQRTIGHSGKTLYFRTELVLVPDAQFGIFVAYNSQPLYPRAVIERLLDEYFQGPPQPRAIKVPTSPYIGYYEFSRHSHRRIEKLFTVSSFEVSQSDDKLLISNIDGIRGEHWVAIAPDTFRRERGEEQILFKQHADVMEIVGPRAISPSYRMPFGDRPFFRLPDLESWVGPWLTQRFVGLVVLAAIAAMLTALGTAALHRITPAALLLGLLGAVNTAIVGALVFAARAIHAEPFVAVLRAPGSITAAQVLAFASLPLFVACVVAIANAWRRDRSAARVFQSAVLVFFAAFVWWLAYWNVLGPVE